MVDRTKNNAIGTMRHSMGCRLIQSDGRKLCDCAPMDDSKAMTGADVLRIFQPLPPEECDLLNVPGIPNRVIRHIWWLVVGRIQGLDVRQ